MADLCLPSLEALFPLNNNKIYPYYKIYRITTDTSLSSVILYNYHTQLPVVRVLVLLGPCQSYHTVYPLVNAFKLSRWSK